MASLQVPLNLAFTTAAAYVPAPVSECNVKSCYVCSSAVLLLLASLWMRAQPIHKSVDARSFQVAVIQQVSSPHPKPNTDVFEHCILQLWSTILSICPCLILVCACEDESGKGLEGEEESGEGGEGGGRLSCHENRSSHPCSGAQLS